MTNSDPPITTAQATIATATVQIKTLTVSGKKMTLAVFRQLPSKRYCWIGQVDDGRWGTGHLAGATPWGWVNYHSEWCKGLNKHLHLVFDHQGVLYEDSVPHSASKVLGWPFERGYVDGASIWYTKPGWERATPDTIETVAGQWADLYSYLETLPQLYIAT